LLKMSWMFDGATHFNGDLGHWDVANVAYMSYMFRGATQFSNGDISQWDVRNVQDMEQGESLRQRPEPFHQLRSPLNGVAP
jgi:surface protein